MRKRAEMPPFYKESPPLQYVLGETPGRGYAFNNPVPLFYEFPDFTTSFVFSKSGIVGGARTVSKDGRVLAEATVNYSISNSSDGATQQGIELEEFHDGEDGRLIFTENSKID